MRRRRCFALPLAVMLGIILAVTVRDDWAVLAVVGAGVALAAGTWFLQCRHHRGRSGRSTGPE